MRYCPDQCPCAPPTCETTINVRVIGCEVIGSPTDNPIEGATVTVVVGGVTIATGTTDSDGSVSFTVNTTCPTSATVAVAGILGYAGTSSGHTLNGTTLNIDYELGPDSDHICIDCCTNPVPKVLEISTVAGDVEVTWNGGGWAVTLPVSTTRLATCADDSCDCGSPVGTINYKKLTISSGDTDMQILLSCVSGAWTLEVGGSFIWGRTSCDGEADWGYADGACPTGVTIYSVYDRSGTTTNTMTGTCADGVVSLSGTIPSTFSPSFTIGGSGAAPICFGSTPASYSVSPPNLLAGSVTVQNP